MGGERASAGVLSAGPRICGRRNTRQAHDSAQFRAYPFSHNRQAGSTGGLVMPSSRAAVQAIRRSARRLASPPLLRRHPWLILGGGSAFVAAAVAVSLVLALG